MVLAAVSKLLRRSQQRTCKGDFQSQICVFGAMSFAGGRTLGALIRKIPFSKTVYYKTEKKTTTNTSAKCSRVGQASSWDAAFGLCFRDRMSMSRVLAIAAVDF